MKNSLLNDPELQAAAQRLEARERIERERIAQLVAPDNENPLEALERMNAPATHARKQLRKMGVEAVRPVRSMLMGGQPLKAKDILFLWPNAPMPGFVTRQQAERADADAVEWLPDGALRVLRKCLIGGKTCQQGATLELWPEQPPQGFISPLTMLEGIKAGDLEPVELQPEETTK